MCEIAFGGDDYCLVIINAHGIYNYSSAVWTHYGITKFKQFIEHTLFLPMLSVTVSCAAILVELSSFSTMHVYSPLFVRRTPHSSRVDCMNIVPRFFTN